LRRREFCKLMAAAASASALPGFAQAAESNEPELPSGFNQDVQEQARTARREIVEERIEGPAYLENFSTFCSAVPSRLAVVRNRSRRFRSLAANTLWNPSIIAQPAVFSSS
jgi:hypothetical protein